MWRKWKTCKRPRMWPANSALSGEPCRRKNVRGGRKWRWTTGCATTGRRLGNADWPSEVEHSWINILGVENPGGISSESDVRRVLIPWKEIHLNILRVNVCSSGVSSIDYIQ